MENTERVKLLLEGLQTKLDYEFTQYKESFLDLEKEDIMAHSYDLELRKQIIEGLHGAMGILADLPSHVDMEWVEELINSDDALDKLQALAVGRGINKLVSDYTGYLLLAKGEIR